MSFVNVWIAFREADHNELNNMRGADQSGLTKVVRDFVNGQLDPAVVQNLYKTRTQGPNVWHLWSIILNSEDGPFNQQINDFRQQYPGCQVLGCWNPDGTEYGTARDADGNIVGLPAYTQPDFLLAFMPDVWNGDDPPTFSAATQVTDVNLPAGWAPRVFA